MNSSENKGMMDKALEKLSLINMQNNMNIWLGFIGFLFVYLNGIMLAFVHIKHGFWLSYAIHCGEDICAMLVFFAYYFQIFVPQVVAQT